MLNLTNIPAARVAFIDPRSNFVTRDWYKFLFNLFLLNGSGQPAAALSAITVTGSPFTYINTSYLLVDLMISGGTVTNLEFSRDGLAFFNTGSYYGMFGLSPGDRLRVTYTSTPTITLVPR
jgi:hypothetical protein